MKKKKTVAMLIVAVALLAVVISATCAFYIFFPDVYNAICRFAVAWFIGNGIGKFVVYLFKEEG